MMGNHDDVIVAVLISTNTDQGHWQSLWKQAHCWLYRMILTLAIVIATAAVVLTMVKVMVMASTADEGNDHGGGGGGGDR